jgi:hypothetical protein
LSEAKMMRITFERTGGFAGLRYATTVEMDSLPAEEARELLNLIEAANFFNLPENMIKQPVPDEFSYTITIESDKGQHTVQTSDAAATGELQALLSDLSRRARPQRRF